MLRQRPEAVDFLVLGAGWTSQFLIPELHRSGITHAETTTRGRDNTIPFVFDPESDDLEPYERLPSADTVLITFPLRGHGQSRHITSLYRKVHGEKNRWIQLGSSGIFNKEKEAAGGEHDGWSTEESEYDRSDRRAIAEDELRECVGGCVLNLSGLYGGERKPKNWLGRLAKSKEDVKARGSVHFVHGEDVARAIVATHRNFTVGKRWIVTDLRVYDWWDLILSFSAAVEKNGESVEEREKGWMYGKWVQELMIEENVRALPRSMEVLGRKLDSRNFWRAMGIWPSHGRLA